MSVETVAEPQEVHAPLVADHISVAAGLTEPRAQQPMWALNLVPHQYNDLRSALDGGPPPTADQATEPRMEVRLVLADGTSHLLRTLTPVDTDQDGYAPHLFAAVADPAAGTVSVRVDGDPRGDRSRPRA